MQFDRNKSLQQLDGQDWGEPTFGSSLVTECHRLRRIPLRDFTVENLRILIGQQIGLEYLLVLALERLNAEPSAEGDYYPGDLLVSVLKTEARFWPSHPELRKQAATIAERAIALFPKVLDFTVETETQAIKSALEDFQRQQPP